MTNPIINELERRKRADMKAREDALASELWRVLPPYVPPEIDSDTFERLRPFTAYCAERGIPHLPCRPETVAAFLLAHLEMMPAPDRVVEILGAIEALHDANSLPSPVRSSIVAAVLAGLPARDPPRSWPKADKLLFLTLPLPVQHIIGRREAQRDRELQRIQGSQHRGNEHV